MEQGNMYRCIAGVNVPRETFSLANAKPAENIFQDVGLHTSAQYFIQKINDFFKVDSDDIRGFA